MEEWAQPSRNRPLPWAIGIASLARPGRGTHLFFGGASFDDPSVTVPGMLTVVMDLDGSLRRFAAFRRSAKRHQPRPPRRFGMPCLPPLIWIRPSSLRRRPNGLRSVVTDTRAAWTGPYRDRTDLPVRIEAASFHGRPVYFQIIFPWTSANRFTPATPTTWEKLRSFGSYALGALVLLVGAALRPL